MSDAAGCQAYFVECPFLGGGNSSDSRQGSIVNRAPPAGRNVPELPHTNARMAGLVAARLDATSFQPVRLRASVGTTPGRGSSAQMTAKVSAVRAEVTSCHDYSRAERRGRDGSCTSGLQFWALHSVTAEAVAKSKASMSFSVRKRTHPDVQVAKLRVVRDFPR